MRRLARPLLAVLLLLSAALVARADVSVLRKTSNGRLINASSTATIQRRFVGIVGPGSITVPDFTAGKAVRSVLLFATATEGATPIYSNPATMETTISTTGQIQVVYVGDLTPYSFLVTVDQ